MSYHVETESGIVIHRQLRSRCTDNKELQNEKKGQDNFDDSPIVRRPQNSTPPTVTVSAPVNFILHRCYVARIENPSILVVYFILTGRSARLLVCINYMFIIVYYYVIISI